MTAAHDMLPHGITLDQFPEGRDAETARVLVTDQALLSES